MSSTLKIGTKSKTFAETGSVFDSTEIAKILTRAGSHDNVPTREIDSSAFSFSKKTLKPDPSNFTKKLSGNGGTLVPKVPPALTGPELAQQEVSNKQSKILKYPAFCPRPNPPNTELRRFN